jgi:hypothetical protein
MPELYIPTLDMAFTFGDDTTIEEAAVDARSQFNPKYNGTPYQTLFDIGLKRAVANADPMAFAIDRTLLGEAYAGVARGVGNTLGSVAGGLESLPEAIIGEDLFGGYFQEWGQEIFDSTLRGYRPGRDNEIAGGIGEAVGSVGVFLTASLVGAGVGAATMALAPALGIGAGTVSLLVAGGLGALAMADEGYQRAVEDGASEDDIRVSTMLNSVLGAAEAFPATRLLGLYGRIGLTAGAGKLAVLKNKYHAGAIDDATFTRKLEQIGAEAATIKAYVREVVTDAGLEGSQEAIQAVGSNVIERMLYNPDQEIMNTSDIEQGLYGGVAGGIFSALLSRFKIRGDRARVGNLLESEMADNADARRVIAEEVDSPALQAQIASLPGMTARSLASPLAEVKQKFGIQTVKLFPDFKTGEVKEKLIIPTALDKASRDAVIKTLGADNVVLEEAQSLKQIITGLQPTQTAAELFKANLEKKKAAKLKETVETQGLVQTPVDTVGKTIEEIKKAKEVQRAKDVAMNKRLFPEEDRMKFGLGHLERLGKITQRLAGKKTVRTPETVKKSFQFKTIIERDLNGAQEKIHKIFPNATVLSPDQLITAVRARFGEATVKASGLDKFSTNSTIFNPDGSISQDYIDGMNNAADILVKAETKQAEMFSIMDGYISKLTKAGDRASVRKVIGERAVNQFQSQAQKNAVAEVKRLAGSNVMTAFSKGSIVTNLYNKFTGKNPEGTGGTVVGGFALGVDKAILLDKDIINKQGKEGKLLVGEEAFHILQMMGLTKNESDILFRELTPEVAELNGIDLTGYSDILKPYEAQAKLAAKAYAEGIDSIQGLRKKGLVGRILAKLKKFMEKFFQGISGKGLETQYRSADEILRAFVGGDLAQPSRFREPSIVQSKNMSEIYASGEGVNADAHSIKALDNVAKILKEPKLPKSIKGIYKDAAQLSYSWLNTFGNFISKYEGLRGLGVITARMESKFNDVIQKSEDILRTGLLERHSPAENAQITGFLDAAQTIMNISTKATTVEQLQGYGITNEETIRKIMSESPEITIADFQNQDIKHPYMVGQTFRIDSGTVMADSVSRLREVFDLIFQEKVDAFAITNINMINSDIAKADKDYLPITLRDVQTNSDVLNASIDQLKENDHTGIALAIEQVVAIYNATQAQKRLLYFPSIRPGNPNPNGKTYGFKYIFNDINGKERNGFVAAENSPKLVGDPRSKAEAERTKFFKDNPLFTPDSGVFELTFDEYKKQFIDAPASFAFSSIFDSISNNLSLSEADSDLIADLRTRLFNKVSTSARSRILPTSENQAGYLHNSNISTYLSGNLNTYIANQANIISRMPDNIALLESIAEGKRDKSIPTRVMDSINHLYGPGGYLSQVQPKSSMAKKLAFFFWLGWNPSSALVNLSGLLHTTVPLIMAIAKNPAVGVKHLITGVRLALKMSKQMPLFPGTKGGLKAQLRLLDFANEPFNFRDKPAGMPQDTWDVLVANRSSLAPLQLSDVTSNLSRDSGLLGKLGNTKAGAFAETFVRASGFAFAWIESMNRVSTAIAAHELYKTDPVRAQKFYLAEGGAKYGEFNAVNFTRFSVEKTQFKFDKTERPRYNRGPFTGVMTQFLPYQSQVYRSFFGALHAGIVGSAGIDKNGNPKKLDPEARAMYQKMSAYMGVTMASGAGLLGLPAAAIAGDIAMMVASMFGADDEPPEKVLTDLFDSFEIFPHEVSAALANRGILSLAGIEIGRRIGFEGPRQLVDIARGKTPTSPLDYLGPAGAVFSQMSNARRRYNAGDVGLAILELLPPAIKNPALSLTDERTSLSGRPLPVEAFGGIDIADRALQAIGITPTAVVEARAADYEQILMNKNYTERGRKYRTIARNTLSELFIARYNGDTEVAEELRLDLQGLFETMRQDRLENPNDPFSFGLDAIKILAYEDFQRFIGADLPVRGLPKAVRPQFTANMENYGWRYQPTG